MYTSYKFRLYAIENKYKENKVRYQLSEFEPMENRGYSILEVGNHGGNDMDE